MLFHKSHSILIFFNQPFFLIIIAAFGATALLGFSKSTAFAAETLLVPSLKLRSTYDDNVFFDDKTDWELSAIPELEYRYLTETSSLSFSGGLHLYRYLDEDEYDRENQFYSLRADYGLQERVSFSLLAEFHVDHTFESVLEEIGEVINKNKRYRYSLQPGVKIQISPRNFMRLSVRGYKVDYEDDDDNDDDTRDYDSYGLHLVLGHEWSRNTTLLMMADYSRIDIDDSDLTFTDILGNKFKYGQFDQDQEVYELTGGLEHDYSQNLSFSARAGVNLAKAEYDIVKPFIVDHLLVGTSRRDIDEDDYGLVLEAGLEYDLEHTTLGFDLSRSITQTADGENIDRNRFTLSVTHLFSSRLRGLFRGSFVKSKTVEDSQDNSGDEVDSMTYSFSPGLSYVLDPNSAIEFRYDYRAVEDDTDDDFEKRNRFYVQYRRNFPIIME